MSGSRSIERRERGDALSTILGTGDTRAALAQVENNVRAIMEVARERGFITQFRQTNRRTGEVKESEFYGLPAWQLLGMTYGVTPVVTSLDAIDGGWKAYAEARTRDGAVVGADFGLAHRKEAGKERMTDHDLAALASARAKRNALRSALGAALVLAGFDFPDPDAPATDAQVGMLHQLERELGWTHEQGHEAAGVDSYRDLTRERAAEIIDAWSKLAENARRGPRASTVPPQQAPAEPYPPVEGPPPGSASAPPSPEGFGEGPDGDGGAAWRDEPATPEQWERALRLATKAQILVRVRARYPEVTRASEVTRGQLAEFIEGEL